MSIESTVATSSKSGLGDCRIFERAIEREWLVTNGLGGFASGTLSDVNTRRYHGLLMAALSPPAGRTLLVAKVDATVRYAGAAYPLCCNEFVDGTIAPHGYLNLEAFFLDGTVTVWRYALADALLDKRVLMAPRLHLSLAGTGFLAPRGNLARTGRQRRPVQPGAFYPDSR